MSGTKISALPDAGALTGAELVPVVSDPAGTPVTERSTVDAIAARAVVTGGAVPDTRLVSAGAGLTGGGSLAANRTISIPNAAITRAMLVNSAATSVIGRNLGSAGPPADIAAGVDGHVLRRASGSLTFGTVATEGIADGAVTMAKIAQQGATSGQVIKWNGTAWAPAADETGGGGSSPVPGYVAGRWIAPYIGSVGASATLGANAIKFIPFMLDRTITVTGLGCRISTVVASSNVQLAIYAADVSAGTPTGNALLSTGNLSAATAATVSETSLGPVTLDVNTLYWAAINNSAAGIAVQAILGANVSPAARMIGASNLADLSSSATSMALMLELVQTFGTWPSVTGGSFTVSTQGRQAMAFLQIGTLP
jgi:hypothetical protein